MKNKTDMQKIGKIGEDLAETFLVKHGYVVIQRNYLRKFGEIDLICKKSEKTHFIEVKTVSRGTVSRETVDEYRPEDNIHSSKLKRIGRTIEAYLDENKIEGEWEFHALLITLNKIEHTAKIKFLRNLIL